MKVNCDDLELKMLAKKLKGAKQNEDFKQEEIVKAGGKSDRTEIIKDN